MTARDDVCGAVTASGGFCTRKTRDGRCAQHQHLAEPPRPLGPAGRELWDRFAGNVDLDQLLTVSELVDERVALRIAILRGESKARADLFKLDTRIATLSDKLTRAASWAEYARR